MALFLGPFHLLVRFFSWVKFANNPYYQKGGGVSVWWLCWPDFREMEMGRWLRVAIALVEGSVPSTISCRAWHPRPLWACDSHVFHCTHTQTHTCKQLKIAPSCLMWWHPPKSQCEAQGADLCEFPMSLVCVGNSRSSSHPGLASETLSFKRNKVCFVFIVLSF